MGALPPAAVAAPAGAPAAAPAVALAFVPATPAAACSAGQLTGTITSSTAADKWQVWPGGQVTLGTASCQVVVNAPSGHTDLVGTLGNAWSVASSTGFASAVITGYGPVNPGPTGKPTCTGLLSIGVIQDGRPSCSVSLFASTGQTATVLISVTPLPVATVLKAGLGLGTVTSTPVGITCGATCSSTFPANTALTLTAFPAAGSSFKSWTGCTSTSGATCSVTLTANATVTATFDLVPRTLTVTPSGTGTGTLTSSPAGIDCGVTCAHTFPQNTAVTLFASPAPGSAFSGWSGAGCSGTSTCVVTMTNDAVVTANFVVNPKTLLVTKAGAGSGSVSSSPAGIDCGTTCSAPFAAGTSVTLAATPSAGTTFTGWSGSGCTGTAPCTVGLAADSAVTATFALTPKTLTVTKAGAGSGSVSSSPAGIDCGTTCSAPFAAGTSVTLAATPSAGSTFSGWSGSGCSGAGLCTVPLAADSTVTAAFDLAPPIVVPPSAVAPSAPRSVIGFPRKAAAVVTWRAPLAAGTSPVRNYTVTASPGSRRCTTTGALSCTVTGLVNKVTYRFRVTARGAAGVSAASAASSPIIVGTTTAPRSLKASFPAAKAARVTWLAPAFLGAGAVTSYQVRWSANNGRTWSAWASVKLTKVATRTGLVKGRPYTIQVRALNTFGPSVPTALRFLQTK